MSWMRAHASAMSYPKGTEVPIVEMLSAWKLYAVAHEEAYGSPILEDGVLGEHWKAIGEALRGLLNGDCGRLDCGTIDHEIARLIGDE